MYSSLYIHLSKSLQIAYVSASPTGLNCIRLMDSKFKCNGILTRMDHWTCDTTALGGQTVWNWTNRESMFWSNCKQACPVIRIDIPCCLRCSALYKDALKVTLCCRYAKQGLNKLNVKAWANFESKYRAANQSQNIEQQTKLWGTFQVIDILSLLKTQWTLNKWRLGQEFQLQVELDIRGMRTAFVIQMDALEVEYCSKWSTDMEREKQWWVIYKLYCTPSYNVPLYLCCIAL